MTERPETTLWPHTRSQWRRLKLAFAGMLHAVADNIESRVEFAETVEGWARHAKGQSDAEF